MDRPQDVLVLLWGDMRTRPELTRTQPQGATREVAVPAFVV